MVRVQCELSPKSYLQDINVLNCFLWIFKWNYAGGHDTMMMWANWSGTMSLSQGYWCAMQKTENYICMIF